MKHLRNYSLFLDSTSRFNSTGSKRLVESAILIFCMVSIPGLCQASTPSRPSNNPVTTAKIAWQAFVQAVKPTGDSQRPLTFEQWTEQCDLTKNVAFCGQANTNVAPFTSKSKGRRGHGSALGKTLAKGRNDGSVSCSPMTTTQGNTTGFTPPKNLSNNPVFCEEVFVNPIESAFLEKNIELKTINGQVAHGNITFPSGAIELKVDWVPASSFTNASFHCPTSGSQNAIYTEMIQFDGDKTEECYAMVGMHISIKDRPNWLWATFEPNYPVTNPFRCNPDLYSQCFDPWGTNSPRPYGPGITAIQSGELKKLMDKFGLPAVFQNYFLTGVQTQFVQKNGKPTKLGNSFVEYNAGVAKGQASCITCHAYANTNSNASAPNSTFGGPISKKWPFIGYPCDNVREKKNCVPLGPGVSSEDFSWLLGLMPITPIDSKLKN